MAILGKRLTVSPRLAAARSADDTTERGTINLDNILKLIPGDVISLFIAGSGLAAVAGPKPATSAVQLPQDWIAIVFWVCFAVCALLRIAATRAAGAATFSLKGVNWSLVLVTLLAFFVWAHAVSSVGPILKWFYGPIAGFFAMVLGTVAPLFVRADQPQP